MRWLTWLALGILVYLALRTKARDMQENSRSQHRRAQSSHSESAWSEMPGSAPERPSAAVSASAAETMVACAYCEVYFPASEAITSAGQHFCCEEHARLTHSRHSP